MWSCLGVAEDWKEEEEAGRLFLQPHKQAGSRRERWRGARRRGRRRRELEDKDSGRTMASEVLSRGRADSERAGRSISTR